MIGKMYPILNRKARISLLAAVIAVVVSLLVTGLYLGTPATAINTPGRDISDHALIDVTDTGAKCSCDKTFTFYLTVRAVDGDATVRITFKDGDSVDFPVDFPSGQTVSIVQAAGGTPGVDDVLTVTSPNGQIVGWVSILTQSGAHPLPSETGSDFCKTIT